MCHIGMIIRQKRREKKLTAEYIASRLKHPISKQAFAKKERTGNFSYHMVLEVAALLQCDISELTLGDESKTNSDAENSQYYSTNKSI